MLRDFYDMETQPDSSRSVDHASAATKCTCASRNFSFGTTKSGKIYSATQFSRASMVNLFQSGTCFCTTRHVSMISLLTNYGAQDCTCLKCIRYFLFHSFLFFITIFSIFIRSSLSKLHRILRLDDLWARYSVIKPIHCIRGRDVHWLYTDIWMSMSEDCYIRKSLCTRTARAAL